MGAATITHASWDALDTQDFHQRFDAALASHAPRPPVVLLDGSVRECADGEVRQSPGDPSVELGAVAEATEQEIRSAFTAAATAFDRWRQRSVEERATCLSRLAALIERERFVLAASLSLEIGKNRFEAMTEVEEAIALIEYYVAQANAADGFVVNMDPLDDDRSVSALKPFGPWAVYAPANFPLALLIGMTTAALVTGNTVVAKPPEDGSISALRLAELVNEADLPPGVFNIVPGGERVGKEIASQPLLTGIAFTGSSRVGQQLVLRQAERGRPMVAEMGGKNAAIVTASAHLETASEGIARSAFRYSGQKCSACSRVYADAGIFDELVERLTAHARSLRIGVPWLRDTGVGALINRKGVDRYSDAVRASREAASAYVVDLPPGLPSGGAYAAPAVVLNIPDDHWVATDELFVPVLCVQRVDSLSEALRRTNASPYGLTAGIYATEGSELEVFFDEIEAGVAYANRAAGATTGAWPRYQSFGGWKRSGWSGKNAHSPYYLQLFTREQCQTRSV